jgi:hypothetical protein
VPPLFGKDLPPCGPEIQVAYENVVGRLRELWFAHHGRTSATDICRIAKENLDRQKEAFPNSFAGKPSSSRPRPWRRQNVFNYELKWIAYFIREAQILDGAHEKKSEAELLEFKKESPVPNELGLHLNNGAVIKMWGEWHGKKRVLAPVVPVEIDESILVGTKQPELNTSTDGHADADMLPEDHGSVKERIISKSDGDPVNASTVDALDVKRDI